MTNVSPSAPLISRSRPIPLGGHGQSSPSPEFPRASVREHPHQDGTASHGWPLALGRDLHPSRQHQDFASARPLPALKSMNNRNHRTPGGNLPAGSAWNSSVSSRIRCAKPSVSAQWWRGEIGTAPSKPSAKTMSGSAGTKRSAVAVGRSPTVSPANAQPPISRIE